MGKNKNIYVPSGVDFQSLIDRAAKVLQSQRIELNQHSKRMAYTDSDVVIKALQFLVGDIKPNNKEK